MATVHVSLSEQPTVATVGYNQLSSLLRLERANMKLPLAWAISILIFGLTLAGNSVVSANPVNLNQAYTGVNAGDLDGSVVDGSAGSHPGIVGAPVCFTDITGCTATNSTGGFLFQNIAAGGHTIQVAAQGFSTSSLILVQVSTGELSHAGQIGLQPVSAPWYDGSVPFIAVSIVAAVALLVSCILAYKVRGHKNTLK